MKKQLIILLITVFISRYNTYSQESVSVDKWKEYIEELAEESANENQLEALYTELSYLSEHPMDLNQVTAEELSRLPFLTDRQIEQLIAYRKKYGEMVSIYELKGVNGLDYQTIQLLLPFVYVGEKTVDKWSFTVKNLLKYGNNEFGFYFDFIRTSIDNINVTRNVTIKLSSVERDVLSLIDSKKGIKRSELAQELDKTEMTIIEL